MKKKIFALALCMEWWKEKKKKREKKKVFGKKIVSTNKKKGEWLGFNIPTAKKREKRVG